MKTVETSNEISADACYWLKCTLEMKIYGIV